LIRAELPCRRLKVSKNSGYRKRNAPATPTGSGQPSKSGSDQQLKTAQPRIDETPRKTDATPSGTGDKTANDSGKGNHATRSLQEHTETAKVSETSTKASQEQFAHKANRASDGSTEHATRNVTSDRGEASQHVAHTTETGHMSEMRNGGTHAEGHNGLAGMRGAGHGGMGGAHMGGVGGLGGLGGLGGMLMGGLGRI
jgi:hypothetical protein